MLRRLMALTAIAVGISGAAHAEFPEGPITIVVPNGAGSGLNRLARVFEPALEANLGVPVNVEVMPGAGTTLGTRHVIEAEPDGYTILVTNENLLGVFGQNKIDPYGLDDLELIAKAGGTPTLLVSRTGLEGDPVDILKSSSGDSKLKAAVQIGAVSHIVMLDLAAKSGAEFQIIHQGGGEQNTSIIAGTTDVTVLTVSNAAQHYEAGTMRVMATGAQERLEQMPDVPTFDELGLDVNFSLTWLFFAPKGTPEAVIERLADAFEAAFNDAEVANQYVQSSMLDRVFLRGSAAEEYVVKKAKVFEDLAVEAGLRN